MKNKNPASYITISIGEAKKTLDSFSYSEAIDDIIEAPNLEGVQYYINILMDYIRLKQAYFYKLGKLEAAFPVEMKPILTISDITAAAKDIIGDASYRHSILSTLPIIDDLLSLAVTGEHIIESISDIKIRYKTGKTSDTDTDKDKDNNIKVNQIDLFLD